jgi:hypothetical protein
MVRFGWSKSDLIQQANSFAARVLRLPEPPTLPADFAAKLGLDKVYS